MPVFDYPVFNYEQDQKVYDDLFKKFTILEAENKRLKKDSDKLAALEAAGVDNWCGYDDAMDILHEWESEENE